MCLFGKNDTSFISKTWVGHYYGLLIAGFFSLLFVALRRVADILFSHYTINLGSLMKSFSLLKLIYTVLEVA